MRPVGRNVLIKPFEREDTYHGIVHLPDTAKSRSNDGIVLSVGEWVHGVKPGDFVIFSRRQARDVEQDGEQLIIVSAGAIICTIEDYEDAEIQAKAELLRSRRTSNRICGVCWSVSWTPVGSTSECNLDHPHDGSHERCELCWTRDELHKMRQYEESRYHGR